MVFVCNGDTSSVYIWLYIIVMHDGCTYGDIQWSYIKVVYMVVYVMVVQVVQLDLSPSENTRETQMKGSSAPPS